MHYVLFLLTMPYECYTRDTPINNFEYEIRQTYWSKICAWLILQAFGITLILVLNWIVVRDCLWRMLWSHGITVFYLYSVYLVSLDKCHLLQLILYFWCYEFCLRTISSTSSVVHIPTSESPKQSLVPLLTIRFTCYPLSLSHFSWNCAQTCW